MQHVAVGCPSLCSLCEATNLREHSLQHHLGRTWAPLPLWSEEGSVMVAQEGIVAPVMVAGWSEALGAQSTKVKIPAVHMLLRGTQADAKEIIEDPHHRQSRYGQHHPHDTEESPTHDYGQQDRDRVDVERPPLDAGH